jgi:hypothetical protein
MGAWGVILPEEATNMVLNPVAMGTGNYTQRAGTTVTQSTTYSYLGYKSYRVETNADAEGIEITLATLPAGGLAAIHYASMRIRGTLPAVWVWSLNGADLRTPNLISIEGDWTIYGCQFSAADSNASTKLYVMQSGAGAGDFYIGHIQVEENTYATTPITGDRQGFTPNGYYWDGTAHASSSVRAANERSGGLVVDLETTYNFRVRYGEGSGMPPITHHVQGMALLPGALYQGHKVEPRVLDLVSATKSNTAAGVAAARKNFLNAVKPDIVSPEQPVVFRYNGTNSDTPVEFHAYYDSGMEFQLSSGVIDKPVARFVAYDPFCYETHTQSKSFSVIQSVADADLAIRKINGSWSNISTDLNTNEVDAIVRGIDGCIYFAGQFDFDGDITKDYIFRWDPYTETISTLGGIVAGGGILALAVAPNGDIYAGGLFASTDAVPNTSKIAYWDISDGAWKSISATNPNGAVYALAFDHSGNLFVGGAFTNLGDGDGDYISKFVFGTGWVSLGSGMNNHVMSLAVAQNGDIYAGGYFTLAGGVADTVMIARWDGSDWLPLGSGITTGTYVGCLLPLPSGNILAGGLYSEADGVSCANIAEWNGKTFMPLGDGLNNVCGELALNDNGLVYAAGGFTEAGGIALSNRMAVWNGTTWAHLDANLPGAPTVTAILCVRDNLYLGYNTEGTAYSSYLNTVTNSGSASAYPIIHIKRAEDGTGAIVEWLKSETTKDTLWLNYNLQKGEELIINLTPGERSIKSSFFGDVWRAVLRSSDLSSFRLLPDTNYISAYVNYDGTITAWLEFPITHWSADAVAA